MHTISHSKHTKLKNTKIYSKGILVNHTKISTNEIFPLYGSVRATFRGIARILGKGVLDYTHAKF